MKTKPIFIIINVICAIIAISNININAANAASNMKPQAKPAYKHTQVVGYLEKVRVMNVDTIFNAKMDTGADTSSMHANIVDLKRNRETEDGKGYVIFTLDTEGSKKTNHIKRPLERMVRIKMRGEAGGYQRRPVIGMVFCIAGVPVREEVNLSNRENFKYDLLVGRNMIAKAGLLIDSNKKYTSKPNCIEKKIEEKNS